MGIGDWGLGTGDWEEGKEKDLLQVLPYLPHLSHLPTPSSPHSLY
ncbi:MAG: hypothetical protein V7L23_06645 [Nostoc sp.]